MPFNRVPNRFYDTSANVFTVYSERVNEPVAGTTNGATVQVLYTPRASGEIMRAGLVGGPAGRCRIEGSLNGSSWTNITTGSLAVGGTPGTQQSLYFRAVAVPFAGDNSEQTTFTVFITAATGEAGWSN